MGANRRTEIGGRRAVGARPHDIRWQFIAVPVVLCGVGGTAGVGIDGIDGSCTSAICSTTALSSTLVLAPIRMGVTMATIVG